MDHEALHRKLAHFEEAIRLAQTTSLEGSAMLAAVSLTLDDAIRVAANIRNRLAGTLRPAGKQRYQVSSRSSGTLATD